MTIKDIARESGYAVSTVSRALNNHPDVSEEAKEKIAAIVAAHSFVPNNNARQLKQQQSTNIAIIVKGSFNMFFASIVEPMQNSISAAGYNAVVHYIDESADEVVMAEQLCREHKPLGIIFLGGNIVAFRHGFAKIAVPCVLATTLAGDLGFENLSSVGVDDTAAGRLAVDYLFEKGHTNIGIIGGDLDAACISGLRYEGCKISFTAHNQTLSEDMRQRANFSYNSAYNAMNRLLAHCKNLTAVFCMSDIMAIGAMRAIRDAGRRVPEDISVIGFDGIEIGRYYSPKLTTIMQPQMEIASTSVELLISHIEKNTSAKQVIVGCKLVEGESVCNFKL